VAGPRSDLTVFFRRLDYVDTMRRFLVFLLALALLLVGGDVLARLLAQKALADRLAPAAGLAEEPQVGIHGFPFVSQVLSGHYQHLTVTATKVPLDEGLTADEVTADIRDVTLPLSDLSRLKEVPVTAGEVRVSARLGYPALSAAATTQLMTDQVVFEIGYVDADRVHVTASTEVLGRTITAEADAVISLTGQTLVIDFTEDLFGDVPTQIAPLVVAISSISFPLDLPYGLHADQLRVTAEGVTLTAEGSPVALRNP
jgi:hypothetical protein